jgi:hypothetical protein
MALTEFEHAMVEVAMEAFVEEHRPPERVRDKVDLSFRIEDQSVIIFELRPSFRDPATIVEEMIAKTTFVRNAKIWKVYWQRADLKWHSYQPAAEVRSLDDFLAVVEEDQHFCFRG